MTTKTELVKKAFGLMGAGHVAEMADYLANDFTISGPVPKPLNKDRFLALMHSLIVAIPDWNFNMTDLCEQGDMVRMKVHITGTNTGEIDIPPLGLQHVPATNKCFALPDERIEITLAGDKIVSFKAIVPADGGVPGILQRLGVKIPEAVKV